MGNWLSNNIINFGVAVVIYSKNVISVISNARCIFLACASSTHLLSGESVGVVIMCVIYECVNMYAYILESV